MGGAFRVFVVDDDPVILAMVEAMLADDCQVETFPSAPACLARLASDQPDLFVLDVTMPEMDGYELCRRLKDDFMTQDIPVTFISASDDIETRLKAYEAGADDFIIKPFDPAELYNKIKVAERLLADKKALREQAGYAQRTALSAMTSMGELGVVLQFLSKSFACKTLHDVGEALLQALQQYDLQGAVQMRVNGECLSMSPNGTDLPLEVAVLNHVREAGRIFQFKSRCVFNYGRVTVMVNNMPLDDQEKAGRIRDNGAILAEGADARLHAIEIESESRRREEGVLKALPQVHAALDAVQANYRRNCFDLTQHMIEYQESLLKSFVNLGLMESQEEFLTRLANEFAQRIIATQDQSLGIVGQLEQLAGTLGSLVGAGN